MGLRRPVRWATSFPVSLSRVSYGEKVSMRRLMKANDNEFTMLSSHVPFPQLAKELAWFRSQCLVAEKQSSRTPHQGLNLEKKPIVWELSHDPFILEPFRKDQPSFLASTSACPAVLGIVCILLRKARANLRIVLATACMHWKYNL